MPLPATAAKSQSGRKPATDGFDARRARRCRLAAWVLRPSCTFARLSRVDRSAHDLLALLVVPQPSLPTHLNSGFVARFWKVHRVFQRLDKLRVDDSAWCSADFTFWEPSSPPRTSAILSATSTRSFSVDLPACDHHPQAAPDLAKDRGAVTQRAVVVRDACSAAHKSRHGFAGSRIFPTVACRSAPASTSFSVYATPSASAQSRSRYPLSRTKSNPKPPKPSSLESIATPKHALCGVASSKACAQSGWDIYILPLRDLDGAR
ncbi:hypothetical protein C8R45DRAFT_965979 [Mycena sanguinolenta]|nr:hypothetical protein C8R45DRAFT_965979 [Mycena sanguinolenta]